MNGASIFARAGRTVVVRQCRVAEGELLVVLGDDRESRSYAFAEPSGLQQFRARLEHFLLETGWSLFRTNDVTSRQESSAVDALAAHAAAS